MKNQKLKKKIEKVVKQYIKENQEEYHLVVKELRGEREKNKDKFATVSHDKNVKRKVFEIPATLHNMIINECNADELMLMKDGEDGIDYGRWFAKRFPEFSSSVNI
jgi:hypothetical protein